MKDTILKYGHPADWTAKSIQALRNADFHSVKQTTATRVQAVSPDGSKIDIICRKSEDADDNTEMIIEGETRTVSGLFLDALDALPKTAPKPAPKKKRMSGLTVIVLFMVIAGIVLIVSYMNAQSTAVTRTVKKFEKAQCTEVPYDELVKDADKLNGTGVIETGEITEVLKYLGSTYYKIKVNNNPDDTILIVYNGDGEPGKLKKGSAATFWGDYFGLGEDKTNPSSKNIPIIQGADYEIK